MCIYVCVFIASKCVYLCMGYESRKETIKEAKYILGVGRIKRQIMEYENICEMKAGRLCGKRM